MKQHLASLALCSLLFSLCSCVSEKNILGKYRTNFADMGFFGTTITLKQDSSLEYTFSGDMIHHYITGKYKIIDRKVYIVFDKEKVDSNFATAPLFSDTLYETFRKREIIPYQTFFYCGTNKLFFANAETGKKINKATRYNKRKKYFLFGSHYYKKRWYLTRVK